MPQQIPAKSSGPMQILRTAISAVPAVRYALGVAGIIAAAALVKELFSSTQAALLVAAAMLALMALLLVFAAATKLAPGFLQMPALVFTWAILILFVMSSGLTVLSVFFGWPKSFPELVRQIKAENSQSQAQARPPARSPSGSDTVAFSASNELTDFPIWGQFKGHIYRDQSGITVDVQAGTLSNRPITAYPLAPAEAEVRVLRIGLMRGAGSQWNILRIGPEVPINRVLRVGEGPVSISPVRVVIPLKGLELESNDSVVFDIVTFDRLKSQAGSTYMHVNPPLP